MCIQICTVVEIGEKATNEAAKKMKEVRYIRVTATHCHGNGGERTWIRKDANRRGLPSQYFPGVYQ